jgi:hypothetical protein
MKTPIFGVGSKNQGEALHNIKTLVLYIISVKAAVSHQADRGIHSCGSMFP